MHINSDEIIYTFPVPLVFPKEWLCYNNKDRILSVYQQKDIPCVKQTLCVERVSGQGTHLCRYLDFVIAISVWFQNTGDAFTKLIKTY